MIEFDGIQHFEPINYFGGEDAFAECKCRDEKKDMWCEANNIPLLRLRYDQTVNDVVEDLKKFLENNNKMVNNLIIGKNYQKENNIKILDHDYVEKYYHELKRNNVFLNPFLPTMLI